MSIREEFERRRSDLDGASVLFFFFHEGFNGKEGESFGLRIHLFTLPLESPSIARQWYELLDAPHSESDCPWMCSASSSSPNFDPDFPNFSGAHGENGTATTGARSLMATLDCYPELSQAGSE